MKKLRALHERIAEQLNNILNREEECLKDHSTGNAVDNFRPISCLPIMWKLMTGVIAVVTYKHLEGILPEEQKGCRRRSRGTKDQLLIDKAIPKDCKRRHKSPAMAWIDYCKACDNVPHTCIKECLKMFGITVNEEQFFLRSMKKWKPEFRSFGPQFQGDSLSPLLFVLCMVPLSFVLRRSRAGYE